MKQRFSSLDIKVIAHELSASLTSLRLVNIYDISSRVFLFKFARPDHRQQLILDTGFRCHLTSFARTTADAPSAFVARLRKFLKTRRVTAIKQIGTDRILEVQFSDGQYRMFLEFYAGGNVVLTDADLKVICLYRNVTEGAEHEHLKIGAVYNLSERQNVNGIPELTVARVKAGLQKFVDRQAEQASSTPSKKAKKKDIDMLRKAISSSFSEYPPMLLDHAFRKTGFDATQKPDELLNNDDLVQKLMEALQEAAKTVSEIMSTDVVKGFIIAKQVAVSESAANSVETSAPSTKQSKGIMYTDFHPFRPAQTADTSDTTILEFDGFNKAVDDFFSSIEGQKLESKLAEKEEHARKKLEHARQDQQKRLGGLQAVQELNVRKAQAIEANLERVEEATAAINGLIAQGKDWQQIDELIDLEQRKKNPVAEMIKIPLKLNENTATLLLGEWEDPGADESDAADITESEPSDSEDETPSEQATSKKTKPGKQESKQDKRLAVDIDLALSPWANARDYYDQKKTAAVKEEKTLQSSAKALKAQQHKVETDLKRALKQEKQVLRPVRQAFWFEKFFYFISSDGYLVIGAKDLQQNEILYKKHMKKGDVYVHADLNGAVSVIIKNSSASPDAPIPPSTLSQAGNISIATSTAWDSKAVMSAWWVRSDQVSKISPAGDLMSTGTFHIKGEKQYLPPAQLLLGFAVLFRIDEESKARHTKHRVPVTTTGTQSATDEYQAQPELEQQAALEAEQRGERHQDSSTTNHDEDQEDEDDSDHETVNDEDEENDSRDYVNPLQSARQDEHDNDLSEDERSIPEVDEENEMTTRMQESHIAGEQEHQGSNDAADMTSTHDDMDEENDDEGDDETESVVDAGKLKVKGPAQVRGKRGKKKKLATKYADQDEEDREAALKALGSKVGQERAAAEAEARKAREEEITKQKQRRREQHERAQRQAKDLEAARQQETLAGEANGEADEDGEEEGHSGLVDLDVFVGTPLPGDVLVEAIPMCAPWNALGKFKYKAKLQPGSQKKGKAVREILGKWSIDGANKKFVDEKSADSEKIWPQEMELIKGWKDTEVFNVMPVSKVRVMMAGASKGNAGGAKGKARGGRGSKKK